MSSKTAVIPFSGTAEQKEKLYAVMREWKGKGGALMPVLQEAQEIYGYLPIEVQQMISDEMDVPMSEIYGVVTFYAQFNLQPKGKYLSLIHIFTAPIERCCRLCGGWQRSMRFCPS